MQKWFAKHYLLIKFSSFFPISLLSAVVVVVVVVEAEVWEVEIFGAIHLSLAPMGTAGCVKGQFACLHAAP